MGFYIELKKTDATGTVFREQNPPQAFWTLYGLAGFALLCMALAAHSLLAKLVKTGDLWDLVLVGSVVSAVPFYLLIGIKLIWIRRFIAFQPDSLAVGYQFLRFPFHVVHFSRNDIHELLLVNQRPSANVAPVQHDDSQYYIRGHWRLVVKTKSNKEVVLDRHTEKGALHSLQNSAKNWLHTVQKG